MNSLTRAFSYSVGRKLIMAATGLFLMVFLIEHLIGNFLLLKGDGGAAFIEYSASMVHNLLIRIVEVLLFAAIVIHVIDGVTLFFSGRKKRSRRYAVQNSPASWTSRNMIVTGTVIFIFLIVHFYTFFVPYRVLGTDATIYELVIAAFSSPVYVAFYVVAFLFLGLHLKHAFISSMQTLGLRHLKYDKCLDVAGTLYAIVVPLGYAFIALFIYFQNVSGS